MALEAHRASGPGSSEAWAKDGEVTGRVAACLLAHGSAWYALAARQSIRALLRHTDFDIFVGRGRGRARWVPSHPRLATGDIPRPDARLGRAGPFLAKFHAMDACLRAMPHGLFLVLDADAVVGRPLSDAMIRQALAGSGLGLVEQPRVRGGTTDRQALETHYREHTLPWFGAPQTAGHPGDFRFYNTGVILATREALQQLVRWALEHLHAHATPHQVGRHMIADQDYIQYWVNEVSPGICRPLPWCWNHCTHWDDGFPDPEGLIYHLSSFCTAPRLRDILVMALIGRGFLPLARRVIAGTHGL